MSDVKHHLVLAAAPTRSPLSTRLAEAFRAVNNLALQALVAAFADGSGVVGESCACAAVTEVASD